MSRNSRKGRSNKGSGTSSSAAKPPSAAVTSSTVRDFIYLDEGKVFSYLAQIEGGLRLLRHEVESALDIASEETGGDKDSGQHNMEGGISPTATAVAAVVGASAGLPVGLLAGLSGKYSYQSGWETTTPTMKSISNDAASRSDLTILHHAAFDLVMSSLGARVKKASGALTLLPLTALGKTMRRAIEQGVPMDTPDALAGTAAIAALGDLGTQTVVFLESDGNLHAFVEDHHFTVPPSLVLSTYGPCSSVPFTIAYIDAQDTRKARRHIPKQLSNAAGQKTFGELATLFTGFGDMLGMADGVRIHPLAIYREL